MSTRIHIVVPDGLLGRLDGVRGDVPRSRWIVRAIEAGLCEEPRMSEEALRALKAAWGSPELERQFSEPNRFLTAEDLAVPASPQPRDGGFTRVEAPDGVLPEPVQRRVPQVPGLVRASSLVKQGVKPIPKGGK